MIGVALREAVDGGADGRHGAQARLPQLRRQQRARSKALGGSKQHGLVGDGSRAVRGGAGAAPWPEVVQAEEGSRSRFMGLGRSSRRHERQYVVAQCRDYSC